MSWSTCVVTRQRTCERFRNGETDELLARKDVGQDLVLQLLRAEVQDGWYADGVLWDEA
jgi:hypothetical protein